MNVLQGAEGWTGLFTGLRVLIWQKKVSPWLLVTLETPTITGGYKLPAKCEFLYKFLLNLMPCRNQVGMGLQGDRRVNFFLKLYQKCAKCAHFLCKKGRLEQKPPYKQR